MNASYRLTIAPSSVLILMVATPAVVILATVLVMIATLA